MEPESEPCNTYYIHTCVGDRYPVVAPAWDITTKHHTAPHTAPHPTASGQLWSLLSTLGCRVAGRNGSQCGRAFYICRDCNTCWLLTKWLRNTKLSTDVAQVTTTERGQSAISLRDGRSNLTRKLKAGDATRVSLRAEGARRVSLRTTAPYDCCHSSRTVAILSRRVSAGKCH